MSSPDLLVPWVPHSLLSLVGIVLIVGGVWRADRTWDEEGSAAYAKALNSGVQTRSASKRTEKTPLTGAVSIPEADIDEAFPFPWPFLMGWTLFGLSYFSATDGKDGFVVTYQTVAAALVSLALGWIASVPMGDAVRHRNASKKQKLSLAFVMSWLLLVVIGGDMSTLLVVLRALGAILIIASMKVLWKYRKMGDTWEQEGKPNPDPIVYNMGGPMFVFGWFLFWVGMASITDNTTGDGLPIYFTTRSTLAFVSGCGMVPVVMVVDYAHDQGAEFVGFGTDGRYFGRFLESPVPFVTFWTLFGVASLLPLENGVSTRQWIILGNCIAQGIVAGILIQTSLYRGDLAGKTRWSLPFVILFLALAIEIGYGGGLALELALPGAILVIAGQKTVFGDRKRGDYWMDTGEVNPNPIVYSYGEPLFMLGWLLLSLAMSIPM